MERNLKAEQMPCPECGRERMRGDGDGPCSNCCAPLRVFVPIFAIQAPPYGWRWELELDEDIDWLDDLPALGTPEGDAELAESDSVYRLQHPEEDLMDWDEQDRRAAAEERIEMFRNEY